MSRRLRCRERPYIRAEGLEDLVWGEVKRVLQNPALIVAGIDVLSDREGSFAGEIAKRITVDGENNLDITLAVPIEGEGESVAIASQPSPRGREV